MSPPWTSVLVQFPQRTRISNLVPHLFPNQPPILSYLLSVLRLQPCQTLQGRPKKRSQLQTSWLPITARHLYQPYQDPPQLRTSRPRTTASATETLAWPLTVTDKTIVRRPRGRAYSSPAQMASIRHQNSCEAIHGKSQKPQANLVVPH
jgi:hypothetical protein